MFRTGAAAAHDGGGSDRRSPTDAETRGFCRSAGILDVSSCRQVPKYFDWMAELGGWLHSEVPLDAAGPPYRATIEARPGPTPAAYPDGRRSVPGMTEGDPPKPGDIYTHERTFTREDVEQFADLSGDNQPIHTEPDAEGRVVVQGLLTATLPTKIGGELEVLATRMEYEFHAPVLTGETITCVWENESVTERDDRYELSVALACTNEAGTEVLTGETDGIIWKEEPGGGPDTAD